QHRIQERKRNGRTRSPKERSSRKNAHLIDRFALSGSHYSWLHPSGLALRALRSSFRHLFSAPGLERHTFDDLLDETFKPVSVSAQCALDAVHRPPVIVLQTSSQGVGHHLLDKCAGELRQLRS